MLTSMTVLFTLLLLMLALVLVGAIVGDAMRRGIPLSQMTLEQLRAHEPDLDDSVYSVLGTHNAVRAFVSQGSTAPDRVREQIEVWKGRLATT